MGKRVLVVGAGIVGSAIADRLQAEGCTVTVFEADIPAGGCTGTGLGAVLTFDDSPAQLQLTSWSARRWRAAHSDRSSYGQFAGAWRQQSG